VLELRSATGAGGGPEKTILLGAARAHASRVAVTVCYLRDLRDRAFSISTRAQALGLDYVEIGERHSFDPAIWPALRAIVRNRGIDIVHTHEYKTDFLGLLLQRTEGVIPMATVHGWITNTPRERFYQRFDWKLLKRYPLVVTVSDVIRQTLIAHGTPAHRVRRLLNGVDHRQFRRLSASNLNVRAELGLPSDTTVIGSIGRLGAEKRFDVLVKAASQVSPRPAVVLAGDGGCRAELERLADQSGVTLRLLGHRAEVRDVYEALDVFVQSSDTEGIPNAVLEAMAMEVPIVATAVGGTREIVEDGKHGLLVPRRDPEAMASAIRRTCDDAVGRKSRVTAARVRVERELSFDSRMNALEAMYEELADARHAGAR
jgi:glycosyltransferase involved in cell wall biosynthesis